MGAESNSAVSGCPNHLLLTNWACTDKEQDISHFYPKLLYSQQEQDQLSKETFSTTAAMAPIDYNTPLMKKAGEIAQEFEYDTSHINAAVEEYQNLMSAL